MAAVLPDDLTARARIREAAFRRFAAHGVAATSLRAIAEDAGTSAALVVHHFGSKDGLVRAVDDAAVAKFRTGLEAIGTDANPETVAASFGAVFERIIGGGRGDPHVSPARAAPGRAGQHHTARRDARGHSRWTRDARRLRWTASGAPDDRWRPFQVLFLALGSMLLEPLLQHALDGHAYDPDVVHDRSAANLDFFAHGLLQER